jgi:hypothetical protein
MKPKKEKRVPVSKVGARETVPIIDKIKINIAQKNENGGAINIHPIFKTILGSFKSAWRLP